MILLDWISTALLVVGAFFFLAGTVGLLRFPDIYTRLHALAKADNLGLGCVLLGLALQADNLEVAPITQIHTCKLQQMPAPAGELARHGPEGAGNAEVIRG